MQTSTITKKAITPDIPISTVRQTQIDYGSTTAIQSASFSNTSRIEEAGGNNDNRKSQNQIVVGSRFSSRKDRASSRSHNPDITYQHLSNIPISTNTSLNASSRFPSFVSLSSSAGHFRIHPMDHGSKSAKDRVHKIKILEYYLNVLNHVCIGFVTIYMSWICLRIGLAGTALHAWLVTIGFAFLMAEGIMCHYSGNVLTHSFQRDTKTRMHWILQAVGGGLGMLGALIKMIQKGFLIQSTHGRLGLAAFILCLITMLSGLSALYSIRLKQFLSPLMNKTLHNYIGYITLVIALLAQFYGYTTGFFIKRTESDFRTLMKIVTILSILLCSIGPLKTLLKRTQMVVSHFMH